MSYTYKIFSVTVPDDVKTNLSSLPTLVASKIMEQMPRFSSYEVTSSDTGYYIKLKHLTSKIYLSIGVYSSGVYFLLSLNGTGQPACSHYGASISAGGVLYIKILEADKVVCADYSYNSGYNYAISAMEVVELSTGYLWTFTGNVTSSISSSMSSIPAPIKYEYDSGSSKYVVLSLLGSTAALKGAIDKDSDEADKCIALTPLLYSTSVNHPLGVCQPSDDCMRYITANSGELNAGGGYSPIVVGDHVYLKTTTASLYLKIA